MGCECCKVDNPRLWERCNKQDCLLELKERGGKIKRMPTNYTKPKKKRRKRK